MYLYYRPEFHLLSKPSETLYRVIIDCFDLHKKLKLPMTNHIPLESMCYWPSYMTLLWPIRWKVLRYLTSISKNVIGK